MKIYILCWSVYMIYKNFSSEEAIIWGKKYFGDWLLNMRVYSIQTNTPLEEFFRKYTSGTGSIYNEILRGSTKRKSMLSSNDKKNLKLIRLAEKEIMKHPSPDNIVVYRYISKEILDYMKKWYKLNRIKKNCILVDDGFLSTTFTPKVIKDSSYAKESKKILKIYVPKGTPCVYVDLISDMHENEVIFCPRLKLKVISAPIFSKYIECIVVNS